MAPNLLQFRLPSLDTEHSVLFTSQRLERLHLQASNQLCKCRVPIHAGGYPRAWVAEQKHANYFTQATAVRAAISAMTIAPKTIL
jgi:hypothetical protein